MAIKVVNEPLPLAPLSPPPKRTVLIYYTLSYIIFRLHIITHTLYSFRSPANQITRRADDFVSYLF